MECSIYNIRVPDKYVKRRTLSFYAWIEHGVSKALVLGFASHDIECDEPRELYDKRRDMEAASRTMSLKSTLITDAKGRYFDQKWECQAALVALWRKMESLGFLNLPKRNPFLGKRPKHEDIVDYQARFKFFRNHEREFKKKEESWKAVHTVK